MIPTIHVNAASALLALVSVFFLGRALGMRAAARIYARAADRFLAGLKREKKP